MPISKENKRLYPPRQRWKAIRERIMARAGGCCEKCGREDGEVHCVANDGAWCCIGGDRWTSETGQPLDPKEEPVYHVTKTVITISHGDHDPRNNADDNLRALCQRCHLTHDAKHHASSARRTRSRKRGQLEMPGVPE